MSRFPTPAHLASWARFAPGINSSAGKSKGNGSTGHGNRYLARVLGEAAVIVGRTDTFLGARYRRLTRRRGKKKAIVAVGRFVTIIWYLLADPDSRFHDLGVDYYDRHVNTLAKRRNHVRQLEALGYKVALNPQPSGHPPRTPFDGHLDRGTCGFRGEDVCMSGSRKRKSYTPAYRRDAAHLVIDTGRPIAHVAKEIGVGEAAAGPLGRAWNGPRPTGRQRRWTSTSGPSWSGCGPRTPSCGWTGSS